MPDCKDGSELGKDCSWEDVYEYMGCNPDYSDEKDKKLDPKIITEIGPTIYFDAEPTIYVE